MPREGRQCKRIRAAYITDSNDHVPALEKENKDIRRLLFDEHVFRRKLPRPGEALREEWTTYHEGCLYTSSMTVIQSEGPNNETDKTSYDICTASPYETVPEAVSPRSPVEMFTPIADVCPFERCSKRHHTTSPCLFPANNYCDLYDD